MSIAFIDLAMPGIDGLEVARQLKETYGSKAPVLVALTGWDGDENRQSATEAGFDYFLEKPFSLQNVNDAIDTVFARK